jgi:hypothetical protein
MKFTINHVLIGDMGGGTEGTEDTIRIAAKYLRFAYV